MKKNSDPNISGDTEIVDMKGVKNWSRGASISAQETTAERNNQYSKQPVCRFGSGGWEMEDLKPQQPAHDEQENVTSSEPNLSKAKIWRESSRPAG